MTFRLNVRTVAIAAAVLTSAIACSGPSASESPSPSASESPTESVYVATALPTPRTTPPGTPAPIPSGAIGTSAKIKTPEPDPKATATPSPEPALWRLDGYVVDDEGTALASACVVIGPLGCKDWSPKTDDRGYYFIDVAAGKTTFDIYFELPGHKTVWWRVAPDGPMVFNVILPKG